MENTHDHDRFRGCGAADGGGGITGAFGAHGASAGTATGSVSTSVSTTTTVSLSGATETRPINTAVKQCVKL